MARTAHNKQNLVGQTFGELAVIAEAGRTNAGKMKYLCQCSCGKEHTAVGNSLKTGHTTTCGHSRFTNPRNFKHGHTSNKGRRVISKAYTVWQKMKQRCDDPNAPEYKNYGGRGISYDPRWSEFENFLADMGEPPKGLTIERKNNDGNYSKLNCRWATRAEQVRNNRRNVLITFDGKTQPLCDWASELGLHYDALYYRVVTQAWPLEKALTSTKYDHLGRPIL